MIRILSIDGGGIRGIIPALILTEIERRTGRRICDIFDLLAGTSTGGILALGLVRPGKNNAPRYSAGELLELYEREGGNIFSGSVCYTVSSAGGLLRSKYPSEGIDSALEKYFGDTRLSEAVRDVVVTSYEIERRISWFFKSRKAKYLKGYDFYMRDVARATSAAPTYFAPKMIGGNVPLAFVDGGVYANNPSMCAYVEAKTTHKKESDFLLVSLGTGEHNMPIPFEEAKDWGLASWAKPILDVVFDGVDNVVDYQLSQLLPSRGAGRRYYRFQTKLDASDEKMDNASGENIRALKKAALNTIKENSGMLDRLCGQLLINDTVTPLKGR